MSKLKSLEKLRKYELFDRGIQVSAYMSSDELADAIQREVDAQYMKLPVDADNMVIHIGDKMNVNGEKKHVVAVGDSRFVTTDGEIIIAEYHSHAKYETVRDVINALLRERASFDPRLGSIEDLVTKYAEKLQLREGGERI